MKKEYMDALKRQVADGDQNAKVLLNRILKGLPLQGGKPIKEDK